MTRDVAPVSVIVPCYCCSETIERAVLSVVDQQVRPTELLLVDDASPDHGATLAMLHALQHRFADVLQIRVLALEENGGPAVARNAAWEQTSQAYVAFLDADDSWHPEKLRIQYAWMKAHPEVALTGHLCSNPTSSLPDISPDTCPVTSIRKRDVLMRNPFSTPSAMLRQELPFRFEAEKTYAEDFLLWQQIVCAGHPVARLERVMARLYKAPYGAAGLSGRLWSMEVAELDNYRRLRSQGCIRSVQAIILMAYSLAKYVRRLILVSVRRAC